MVEYYARMSEPVQYSRSDMILVNMSRMMWGYKGFSGMRTPWHDNYRVMLKSTKAKRNTFYKYLEKWDMPLEAYCVLSAAMAPAEYYTSPLNLFARTGTKSWLKKLRTYCEDSETFEEVANMVLNFLQLQIQYTNVASLTEKSVIKKDSRNNFKSLGPESYYMVVDRIRQMASNEIDPEIWMEEKVKKCTEIWPGEQVVFNTIVNVNTLEPDLVELKSRTCDPWRGMREFLGISSTCEFTDGYIPKGWRPGGEDREDLTKVIRIDGKGFYYYEDGTQRRGKRHYNHNAYCIIKCTPDNFAQFKEKWDDVKMLTSNPTWLEYISNGAYPGMWNEEGSALNERGRPIKWRKRA